MHTAQIDQIDRPRLFRPGAGSRSIAVAVVPVWAVLVLAPSAAVAQNVSFSRQVAPLLVRHCGNCHVAGRKGGFQMQSYVALMSSGMVQKGAGQASRLVEVIETGDMPRGGGKVSRDDLATIIRWIDSGAACDAADPAAPLDGVARPVAPAAAAAMPAGGKSTAGQERALRPGDVSFAADVAPVLVEHCAGCHSGGNPAGRLQMESLATLLRGGPGGAPVAAGKSADSLIVKKLRGAGIEGQRMPRGRPPLPDDVIAKIAAWIDQGATIDMLAAPTRLETVAARGRARSLSDGELREVRRRAAPGLWKRSIPDEEPVIVPRERLVLVGNLPAARMDEVADLAARLEERIRGELVGGDTPLLKGGIVLYAFRQSYDFSAFWQTVLKQERPKGVSGHAGVAGDVAYGAFLMPGSAADPVSIDVLVAEQIAGAALAGRNLPPWFVTGAARVAASRVMPKAPIVQEWRRDAGAAARELGSPADFFAGHGDPAATATAAAGFVTAIATPAARLKQLVAAIDDGMPLDEAIAKLHRGAPQQLYEAWLARQAKPRR
jgi:mono/diheme cytochrome c family protein